MAPRLAAHETAIMLDQQAVPPRRGSLRAARRADAHDEQRRVLELRYKWLVRAGAKLARQGTQARVAEINQRLATLATQFSARTCWRTSSPGAWCWRASAISPACRRRVRDAAGARRRPTWASPASHVITLSRSSDRAVPAVLGAARSARGGVQRLDPARREWRRDRQPQHHRRDRRAARRARDAARLQDVTPTTASKTRWPRRRPACAGC